MIYKSHTEVKVTFSGTIFLLILRCNNARRDGQLSQMVISFPNIQINILTKIKISMLGEMGS